MPRQMLSHRRKCLQDMNLRTKDRTDIHMLCPHDEIDVNTRVLVLVLLLLFLLLLLLLMLLLLFLLLLLLRLLLLLSRWGGRTRTTRA